MSRTRHQEHGSAGAEHAEHEDHGWTIELPDHPKRTESAEFVRAKRAVHAILAIVRQQQDGDALLASLTGPAGIQAHHAGSLWVFSDGKWALFLNVAGVEWSAQWSADPAKIDLLRQNAQRLYERFPETLAEFTKLGYDEAARILREPVTDHTGVARWTDSLFNSCVPLSPTLHQAIVTADKQVGGWHHYPKSIWDMQVTKHDDFRLWVTTPDGYEAAVAPAGHRGSGDARVKVVWSHPSSALHAEHMAHEAAGEEHVLPADHDLAKQAFSQQTEVSA